MEKQMLPGPWIAGLMRLRGLAAGSLLALLCASTPAAAPAPLRVQGNITTIEFAPVLLAAQRHRAPVAVSNGSVADLAGPPR
jgi:hypothetical protein